MTKKHLLLYTVWYFRTEGTSHTFHHLESLKESKSSICTCTMWIKPQFLPIVFFFFLPRQKKKKICKFPWIPNLYWNFHTMSGTEPPARSWQQSLITVGAVQSWPPRVTQLRGSCSGNRRGGEGEGCGEGAEGGPRQRTFPAPGIGAYSSLLDTF